MLQVFDNLETLSRAAAELFAEQAAEAVRSRGRFTVALAGGQTPRRTYELLAEAPYQDRVDWAKVNVFWGDERCVPASDPRNNARMARHALLDQVPIPAGQIHPIRGWKSPDVAAADYEADLREFFADGPSGFDLVLLGLGEDGHTASLFPEDSAIDEEHRWAVAVATDGEGPHRVTLTAPRLNEAALVVFLVAGDAKAEALRRVLSASPDPYRTPAALIHPAGGDLRWFADRAAGQLVGTMGSQVHDDSM